MSNTEKVDLQALTVGEINTAEKKSGQSLSEVMGKGEDAPLPLNLLAALVWVHRKRQDPSLDFNEFRDSTTLAQLQNAMVSEDDSE